MQNVENKIRIVILAFLDGGLLIGNDIGTELIVP